MLNETISEAKRSLIEKTLKEFGLYSEKLKKVCENDKEYEYARFYYTCRNVEDEVREAYRDHAMEEWFKNQVDVVCKRGHTEVIITFGGPTIRLFTGKNIMRQTWGFVDDLACELPIAKDVCRMIDEYSH